MDERTETAMPGGTFPVLDNVEPTRETLHAYSKILDAVSRAHADPHPKWWHISLSVQPAGLVTDDMTLPDGGSFRLGFDLRRHDLVLSTTSETVRRFGIASGPTATELGDRVLESLAELGLEADYDRERFTSEEPRRYEAVEAEKLRTALTATAGVLERHRKELSGEVGPVQLWPHHFDLAFEWFGTRTEIHEEDGEEKELPAQINFGFFPGEPVYFYANPWPFDADELTEHELPGDARWHQEGWEGTMYPYAELAGKRDAAERLQAYFRKVFEVAAPTLRV